MEKYDPNIDYYNKYKELKREQSEQEYFNAVGRLHHQCVLIAASAALAGLYCYFQTFPSFLHFAGMFVLAFAVAFVLFWFVSGMILTMITISTNEYTKKIKLWVYYTISALLPLLIAALVIYSQNHESW